MDTSRLTNNVDGAVALGRAKLANKILICNKPSSDGSAKANLVEMLGSIVWGVIFSISTAQMKKLDRVEGVRGGATDYARELVEVECDDGSKLAVTTYIAPSSAIDLTTFEWYKALIIKGAREHNLPEDYIAGLDRILSRP